jgi:hypothetical protein
MTPIWGLGGWQLRLLLLPIGSSGGSVPLPLGGAELELTIWACARELGLRGASALLHAQGGAEFIGCGRPPQGGGLSWELTCLGVRPGAAFGEFGAYPVFRRGGGAGW